MKYLFLLLPLSAFAATTATVTTQPTFDLYQGSSLVSPRVTRPTFAECVEAGRLLNKGDCCQSRNGKFKRATVADPVDCVTSPAVEVAGAWSACSAGTRSRTITSTLTVTTQPANGGLACPVLVTTRVEVEACTVALTAKITMSPMTLPASGGPLTATWECSAGTATLSDDGGWSMAVARSGSFTDVAAPPLTVSVTCREGNQTAVDSKTVTLSLTPTPPNPAVGTAALTWIAPTQNTDGSALTDLAGYRVYHGLSSTALTDVVHVTATSYSFTGLASGTHYFAVSAVNAAGVESAKSAVGSKVVP
jgi:hypothetical protein